MNSVAVFCGSSSGNDPIFERQAYRLGKALAEQGRTVVYGGAKVGLMGKVADGALDAGGKVIGVLPGFLKTKEVAHEKLSDLIVVETMHERKTKMSELSDGIIALPGGFGTMEEYFEILTWAQLGLHQRPMGLLNVNGFYDPLLAQFKQMVTNELLKPANYDMVLHSSEISDLLQQMENHKPGEIDKWIQAGQT